MEPAAASSEPDTGIRPSCSAQLSSTLGQGEQAPSPIPLFSPSRLSRSLGASETPQVTNWPKPLHTNTLKTLTLLRKRLHFQVVSTYLGFSAILLSQKCTWPEREQGKKRAQREHHNKSSGLFYFMYVLPVCMYVCTWEPGAAEVRR